jgi:hypothetical protein
MTEKHVFLSYIHEDKEAVDTLQDALQSAGFSVWRDTHDLFPGDNWEVKIKQAIQDGSLIFLACFSSSLDKREVSYQYAELMLAAEQYRLRPPDTSWLMTARLDECEIPSVDLGGGRTLNATVQRIDLFGPQAMANIARLVTAIHRVLDASPGRPLPAVEKVIANSRIAENSDADNLRSLIRNPALVMDFDEYAKTLTKDVLNQMRDRRRFSFWSEDAFSTLVGASAWVARMHDYETLITPLLEPIKIIAMYAPNAYLPSTSRLLKAVASEAMQSEGVNALRYAHQYPALILTYAAGLAAYTKNNYEALRAVTEDVIVNAPFDHQLPFIALSGADAVCSDKPLASLLVRSQKGETLTEELVELLHTRRIGALLTPVSDSIFNLLGPLFRDEFSSDEEYAEAFDQVEILFDAVAADVRLTTRGFNGGRNGYGRYTWRSSGGENAPEVKLLAKAKKSAAGWTPVVAGMFGGDKFRAIAALEEVNEVAGRMARYRY